MLQNGIFRYLIIWHSGLLIFRRLPVPAIYLINAELTFAIYILFKDMAQLRIFI
jgi:hypothetical protein